MGFQPPRIIGGGQIIQPQAQGNPFQGIEDAVVRARDRKQKQELIDLQRQKQYFDEFDPTTSAEIDQYMQYYNPNANMGFQSPRIIEGNGFLGLAKSLFPRRNDSQQMGGPPMNNVNQPQYQNPNEPMVLNPNTGVNYPAYEEQGQFSGRPSPKLNRLQRAGNWMKDNVFNQSGSQGEGGGRGVGPLQTTPESGYQKQLHSGTAQKRDSYGYGNVQEDTGDAPKENIFTKAKDLLTKPSKRKYENAAEEGREIVRNLDLSDNDAVMRFQETMGLEADGIAGKNTLAVIRALQSGEHERATSGYRPDMQITGIGNQQGGYSMKGGGNVPGNSTGDNNPAMLEDGEYVLNRNAVKKIGKGYLDWINHSQYPRFQSGGFKEPDIYSAPPMQRGGVVRRPTGYQNGGFSLPMSRQHQLAMSQLEDDTRRRQGSDIMGDIFQEGNVRKADTDAYNKQIEKRVTQEENSPLGYLDWAMDYVIPPILEKPMMGITRGVQQLTGISDKPGEQDWFTGAHIPEGKLPSSFYDARRVTGERQMDEYEKGQLGEFQKSALELTGENPGVLSPEQHQYIQGMTSIPDFNPYANLSNRAMKRLYKEAIQESENNPMDLMNQLYGNEWWKSQQ